MKNFIVLFIFILLLVGCKSEEDGANVSLEVKTYSFSFEVPVETTSFKEGQHINFYITLENMSGNDANLKFPSGQQYDIELINSADKRVWLWSNSKVFTQANTNIIIYGYEKLTIHDSAWNAILADGSSLPAGEYTVRAWLTNGKGNLANTKITIEAN